MNGLFEALGEKRNSTEQTAIEDGRFDVAIDLLERRVGNRALVRENLRGILTPKPDFLRVAREDQWLHQNAHYQHRSIFNNSSLTRMPRMRVHAVTPLASSSRRR